MSYNHATALTMQADTVFTAFFALEMVMKLIAMGIILHKDAYFRTAWNW